MGDGVIKRAALEWLEKEKPSNEEIADKIVETASEMHRLTQNAINAKIFRKTVDTLLSKPEMPRRRWWEIW